MNRKKILYGIESAEGGSWKHLNYLLDHLDTSRFEMTLILSTRCNPLGFDLKKWLDRGIKIHVMPMRKTLHISDIWFLFKIYHIIKTGSFDVVHAHSTKAGFLFRTAAWANNVPMIVFTPHCFYFQAFANGIRKSVFVIMEKLLARATHYIIVSENEKKAAEAVRLCSSKKLLVINNAITQEDLYSFEERGKIKSYYNIRSDIVIGSIGRLTAQKDWHTYVLMAREVLIQHPEVTFLIVGSGEDENVIKRLICDLQLEDKIILTGYIHDIQKIYTILNIFVSTSLWEGLPYVFLEAMHVGIPVLTTDLAYDFVIRDGINGYVFPVKDYKAISDKIKWLLKHREIIKIIGASAKETVNQPKFSFQSFLNSHEQLYDKRY